MDRILKVVFFGLIIKPIVLIVLGLNVKGKQNLLKQGPGIIAANHNSHLDTMVLMTLYPLSMIHKIRPVAAADYFLKRGGLLAWFSIKCIGIIPMDRSGSCNKGELFKDCHQALDNGDILILFPEGSRGEPEVMRKLKKGLFYIIKDRTDTLTVPVMMHGLGRALPKGEALFVPFNCDVIIGEPLEVTDKLLDFNASLAESFSTLSKYCLTQDHGSSIY